jgi:hypothetical protein
MSGSLPERLSRFTPDPGGLDRDALLFAAGRAAARPARAWVVLSAVLALSQALTLVLLWPRAQPPQAAPSAPPVTAPAAEPTPPASEEGPTQLGALRRGLLRRGGDDLPPAAAVESLIESGPPLHAFSAPPPAVLNGPN